MKKVMVDFDDNLYKRMEVLADKENLPINEYIRVNVEMAVCVSERVNSIVHNARPLADDDYERARQA